MENTEGMKWLMVNMLLKTDCQTGVPGYGLIRLLPGMGKSSPAALIRMLNISWEILIRIVSGRYGTGRGTEFSGDRFLKTEV